MAAGAADGTVDGIADGDGAAAGTVGAGGAAGARDTASLRCTTAGGARGAAVAGSEGEGAIWRYQVGPLPTAQPTKAGITPGLSAIPPGGGPCPPGHAELEPRLTGLDGLGAVLDPGPALFWEIVSSAVKTHDWVKAGASCDVCPELGVTSRDG
jgi:hypothetical protein